jgi:hypothetical protein
MSLLGHVEFPIMITRDEQRDGVLVGRTVPAPAALVAATREARALSEWRDRLQRERRQARQAADNFAAVCLGGDADALHNASLWLDECVDAWRFAMAKVARLPGVSRDIQDAFLPIWIEHKMLPLRVGHRPTLAKALRVLMYADYTGPPLTLYRGAASSERRRRLYGFSWTTDMATARQFAEHWRSNKLHDGGGVVLQAVVPAKAILLIPPTGIISTWSESRGDWEDGYRESEVIVDPYGIEKVKVIDTVA